MPVRHRRAAALATRRTAPQPATAVGRRQRLRRQVEGFLSSCHDDARRLMRANREVLPRLAEELIRRGRLEAAEFRELRVAFERGEGVTGHARA